MILLDIGNIWECYVDLYKFLKASLFLKRYYFKKIGEAYLWVKM